LNPFDGTTVTRIVAELPALTVALPTPVVSVKLGAGTVTVTVAFRVKPPPVPLMVMGKVPVAALADAANVTLAVLAAVTAGAEKLTVTPGGTQALLRVAAAENPPCVVMVRVAAADPPRYVESRETFGVKVKFATALSPQ